MKIAIPVDKFISEHKHLIDVLKHGNNAMCSKEADKQAAELKRVMGRPGVKEHLEMKRPAGMKRQTDGDRLMHNYGY